MIYKKNEYLCTSKFNLNRKIYQHIMTKAKPFIKWVGGKSQLIEQLDKHLPADFGNWEDVTYIEPFVIRYYQIQESWQR